jgi:hypothetical protein
MFRGLNPDAHTFSRIFTVFTDVVHYVVSDIQVDNEVLVVTSGISRSAGRSVL